MVHYEDGTPIETGIVPEGIYTKFLELQKLNDKIKQTVCATGLSSLEFTERTKVLSRSINSQRFICGLPPIETVVRPLSKPRVYNNAWINLINRFVRLFVRNRYDYE